jgi:hypothetical protein
MHVLFLPTLALSLVAASASFGLTNFLVPGMVRNLNEFIRADIGALIRQRLDRPQGITLGRYRIHADECVVPPSDPDRVELRHIAFVEVDGDEWVRFGTARNVRLTFSREEGRVRVAGVITGLSYYDRKAEQFFEEARQTIPPNDIPSPVPEKTKFLKLGELAHYYSNPHEWYAVRRELQRLRKGIGKLMVYDALWADWRDVHSFLLADEHARYTVGSSRGVRIAADGSIELADVVVEEERRGRRRSITAKRAAVEVTRGETIADCGVRIELYDARVSDGSRVIERRKEVLGPVAIPPEVAARVEALSVAQLLNPSSARDDDPLARMRAKANAVRSATIRRVVGTINERAAFSASVFALVILAAALGIIFRGSHPMTAFGISVVPMLFVIVTIVMGKQMSHNAETHGPGLLVLWAGIAVVALLDVWTLTRVIRR